MTLNELIQKASDHYPDNYIALYWDKQKQKVKTQQLGDTLAQFIARELKDTFDPDASDNEQQREACRVLSTAIRELHNVITGLSKQ